MLLLENKGVFKEPSAITAIYIIMHVEKQRYGSKLSIAAKSFCTYAAVVIAHNTFKYE